MACDTFIKIAQKCRRHFVQVQAGEVTPFIEEILSTISTIICDLQPQQVHTFYEAVGYMISAQNEKFVQEPLIERYMLLPNKVWGDIINQATRNVPDEVKHINQTYNLSDNRPSLQNSRPPIRLPFWKDLFRYA
jgi:exportin-1